MKTRLTLLLAALFFLVWIGCEPPPKEGYHLTFQVDMAGVELKDTDTVGLRGSIAPLSWTETDLMEGPDENDIYTVTIPFTDDDHNKSLHYKYIVSDTVWDNDKYGEYGNRSAIICCKKQSLPVDTWNVLDKFASETLFHSMAWDVYMSWIYTLGKAKERGLSMEEAAQEVVDFWDWEPDPEVDLEMYLNMDEFFQAKSPFGYFETIQNTPDKVEYIKNKDWEIMTYKWDPSGEVYGVSADDFTDMFRKMMKIYVTQNGLAMEWQDMDDHKVKITITR